MNLDDEIACLRAEVYRLRDGTPKLDGHYIPTDYTGVVDALDVAYNDLRIVREKLANVKQENDRLKAQRDRLPRSRTRKALVKLASKEAVGNDELTAVLAVTEAEREQWRGHLRDAQGSIIRQREALAKLQARYDAALKAIDIKDAALNPFAVIAVMCDRHNYPDEASVQVIVGKLRDARKAKELIWHAMGEQTQADALAQRLLKDYPLCSECGAGLCFKSVNSPANTLIELAEGASPDKWLLTGITISCPECGDLYHPVYEDGQVVGFTSISAQARDFNAKAVEP